MIKRKNRKTKPHRVSMLERIINKTLPYHSVEVSVSLLQRLHKKNDQLQAELDNLRWIPVSEPPGKPDEDVLWKNFNDGCIQVGALEDYAHESWVFTHWMPIPLLPEAQKGDKDGL